MANNKSTNVSKSKINIDDKPIEKTKKSQKVKILVSVYRVNDKIISALGIPKVTAPVQHIFQKDKIKVEDLFVFTSTIKTHLPYSKSDAYKAVAEQIMNDNVKKITLPVSKANELPNIGTFVHEILNIEIELLS